MRDIVTESEEQKLIKTYELKLALDFYQKKMLENLSEEYRKVQNFVAKKFVSEILPRFKKVPENDIVKGRCLKCYNAENPKDKDLRYFWINEYGKKELNCGCLISHFSLRKMFLPSKSYQVHPAWDMRTAGKLYIGSPNIVAGGADMLGGKNYNRQMYDFCLKKTAEGVKSFMELRKKKEFKIIKDGRYVKELNAINEGKEEEFRSCIISDEREVKRFDKLKIVWDGRDKNNLPSHIKKIEKRIKKMEESQAEGLEFGKFTMRLPPNYFYLSKTEEGFVIVVKKLSEKPIHFKITGQERGDIKIGDILVQATKPEVEIKKKNDNYFLQYFYRKKQKIQKPDMTYNPVGIDLGIINLACAVALKDDKITGVRFWNGRPLRRVKRQYYKIRRIWQIRKDVRHKQDKWYKERINSYNQARFQYKYLHKISKDIVNYVANNFDRPVIILENLKYIELALIKFKASHLETLKKKFKGSARKFYLKKRYLNWEIKNWAYKELANQIEYKANWLGIPVVYVNPKNTSLTCLKCGHIDEKNYANFHEVRFKCLKCGYQANADFVAGTNLARRFLNVGIENKGGKWIEKKDTDTDKTGKNHGG